jgi:NADPH:quinone reductase-like Zn-dependent oxidoreductase
MPKAVRSDSHGGIDVLQVREVERPATAPGRALVRVKAAGINPGESAIHVGLFEKSWARSAKGWISLFGVAPPLKTSKRPLPMCRGIASAS